MTKISKDTPLNEITLRRYEKPFDLNDRELVRKLCLSIGLLQPGDSRDVVVDILHVLLNAKKKKIELSSMNVEKTVIKFREENQLPMLGIASSNIRRQLKRLRDVFLIEKIKNNYRVIEFSSLHENFEGKFEKFLLNSNLERIKEYLNVVDERF